ncbi:tripartite tricarboxylate transporter TctB family protein [uncultured Arthrobacter sp.]|uniref:tripartite tricarboxylate transporter TctB family protein n=1 Tax=uncultured Arthrobacter sp. TaxID=114050 RepID=UPI0026377B73|nr:tripartite tricarboxylate transporter TctB family protein [uncultured Arthrobacter sp.]
MSDGAGTVSTPEEDRYSLMFARSGMGLLLLVAVVATVAAPLTLEIGTLAAPQPGFWVFWVSLATALFIAGTFLRHTILMDGVDPLRKQDQPVLLALPLLFLLVPMLTLFGVSVTTLIVSFYWFRVIAHATWRMTIVGSILVTAGVWIVFIYLLGVPFSPGTLIRI